MNIKNRSGVVLYESKEATVRKAGATLIPNWYASDESALADLRARAAA